VNARLLLTVRKGSVVVPDPVIQRGPEGAFVFVIKDDQTVEVRPVKVALQSEAQIGQGETVIADGLRPGERVVVDGQYKLQAGSHVKMADAAAKPDSQKPKAEANPKAESRTKAKS
jgi:multidrug efflux system membrane fusion protein